MSPCPCPQNHLGVNSTQVWIFCKYPPLRETWAPRTVVGAKFGEEWMEQRGYVLPALCLRDRCLGYNFRFKLPMRTPMHSKYWMCGIMKSLESKVFPRKDSKGRGHNYRNVMYCSLIMFKFLNQILAITRVVAKINSLAKSSCAKQKEQIITSMTH